jgi:hypothetical protein
MHKSWARYSSDPWQLLNMVQQRIHKGSRCVPWRRVHHEASRLIHHNDVIVFIDDREGYIFRS